MFLCLIKVYKGIFMITKLNWYDIIKVRGVRSKNLIIMFVWFCKIFNTVNIINISKKWTPKYTIGKISFTHTLIFHLFCNKKRTECYLRIFFRVVWHIFLLHKNFENYRNVSKIYYVCWRKVSLAAIDHLMIFMIPSIWYFKKKKSYRRIVCGNRAAQYHHRETC